MSSLIGTVLEHYRIESQIGQGGMATVYRAIDERSGARVAVKILSSTISGDRRFIKRFRREAQLVSQLNHPNIVPVHWPTVSQAGSSSRSCPMLKAKRSSGA